MNSLIKLNQQIFTEVFGLKINDPDDIPLYSTSLDCAYKIIRHIQHDGWVFGSKVIHHSDGEISYNSQFVRGKQKVNEIRSTLPLSICFASICVIRKQWTEFEEETDHSLITLPTLPIIHNIGELFVEKSDIYKILLSCLNDVKLSIDNKENGMTLIEILNYLFVKKRITENDLNELPQQVVQTFLNILNDNNLLIIQKDNKSK